jgi:hypothetical protein
MKSLVSFLFLAAVGCLAPIACGPPAKPTVHPGKADFGTQCSESHKCPHDLECIRYAGDAAGFCEKRCNADSDCGLEASCSYVPKAPSPMCRDRNQVVVGPDHNASPEPTTSSSSGATKE